MNTKLSKQEVLALKLKDIQNLSDEECCNIINISLIEFEDLIKKTRGKIAGSILHNKKIVYNKQDLYEEEILEKDVCFFTCSECGSFYKINYKIDSIKCPRCFSSNIMTTKK